jgi:hypothetical protein
MDNAAEILEVEARLRQAANWQIGKRLHRNQTDFFTAWLVSIAYFPDSSQYFWELLDGLENGDVSRSDGQMLAKLTPARLSAFSKLVDGNELFIWGALDSMPRLTTLRQIRDSMLINGKFKLKLQDFDRTSPANNVFLYDEFAKNVNIAFTDPGPTSMGGRGKKKKKSKRSAGSRRRFIRRSGSKHK